MGSVWVGLICGVAAVGATVAAFVFAARARARAAEADGLRRDMAELRAAVAVTNEADALAERFNELLTARDGLGAASAEPMGDLVDPDTGLLDERFFHAALDQRIAAARRQLQPLCLLLVALDGDEVSDVYRREAVSSFAETLARTLRDSDIACRIADTTFGVILEDTPEAGGVWAAERLRIAMLRRGGSLLHLCAAVAAYPSHALDAADVLERAERALAQARTSGSTHVEVASAD
jgi:diguanylate cyclase (GGDEF)-like protein